MLALQLCWVGFSATLRRPWQGTASDAPAPWAKEALRIALPLLLNGVWVLLVLIYLPATQGGTLPVTLLYVPDAGHVLLTSAAVAIGWGGAQAGLRLYTLGRARTKTRLAV